MQKIQCISKYSLVFQYLCNKANIHINQVIVILFTMQSRLYLDLLPPTNLKATALTPNSVEITWDQSSGATGYVISYTATTTLHGKRVIVERDSSISHTLTGLKGDTQYTVTVQGTTNDGNKSAESEQTLVTTPSKWCITIP